MYACTGKQKCVLSYTKKLFKLSQLSISFKDDFVGNSLEQYSSPLGRSTARDR